VKAGWGPAYWIEFYENLEGWKWFFSEPESSRHSRMNIVNDHGSQKVRMFFLTEDAEEQFYGYPGKNDE
jgi:hypothetical protein